MIKELENNELLMWAGDTGTMSFNITGNCQVGDAISTCIDVELSDIENWKEVESTNEAMG